LRLSFEAPVRVPPKKLAVSFSTRARAVSQPLPVKFPLAVCQPLPVKFPLAACQPLPVKFPLASRFPCAQARRRRSRSITHSHYRSSRRSITAIPLGSSLPPSASFMGNCCRRRGLDTVVEKEPFVGPSPSRPIQEENGEPHDPHYYYYRTCPCSKDCSSTSWNKAEAWGWSEDEAKAKLVKHLVLSDLHGLSEEEAWEHVEQTTIEVGDLSLVCRSEWFARSVLAEPR